MLNIDNFVDSQAMRLPLHKSSGKKCKRLDLKGVGTKGRDLIRAKTSLIFLHLALDRIREACARLGLKRKWVKVTVFKGEQKKTILISIRSLTSRTSISRKDLLSKSPDELSALLADRIQTQTSAQAAEPLACEFTDDGFRVMPPKVAGALYQMIHHAAKALDEHGIKYVSDGGTTLGALRHGGLIPHDDDGDFMILPGHEETLASEEFKRSLEAFGLTIVPHWLGFKVFALADHPDGRGHSINGCDYKTPTLDFFTTRYEMIRGERRIVYLTPDARRAWPQSFADEDLVNSDGEATMASFGPTRIPVPAKAREICTRLYGENCLRVAYMQYDHINERGLRRVPINLTDFRAPYYEEWDELPPID